MNGDEKEDDDKSWSVYCRKQQTKKPATMMAPLAVAEAGKIPQMVAAGPVENPPIATDPLATKNLLEDTDGL